MNYRCIIIDDEAHFTDLMQEYISEIPQLKLIRIFHDPVRAIAETSENDQIDIVFLDINMPGLSGIELAPHLKQICRHIVFITSHSQYAVKAFDLDTDDFLFKPFRLERLQQTLKKIAGKAQLQASNVKKENSTFFYIKISGAQSRYIKFLYNEIIAFESDKNYIKIYATNEYHRIYMSLHDVENKLAGRDDFIRVHRSFIISKEFIEQVETNTVIMKKNGLKVVIGKQYREAFFAYLENHRF
ncbi:LytR/AlgR family response regulator transcription factor [Pedobacter africanus]|nr:LytTR family DNA-binding domain-containing protein [Pedobacter africanus]